jgi:hypothetical protein
VTGGLKGTLRRLGYVMNAVQDLLRSDVRIAGRTREKGIQLTVTVVDFKFMAEFA